jgi:NitT/TauT family transport system substrate-binding protein
MTRKLVSDVIGVFSLPWFVARDEGLFAAEGVEVELIENDDRRSQIASLNPVIIEDHRLIPAVQGHTEIDENKLDVFRACEWGQVRRSQDHLNGRIISKRAAIMTQAVFSAPGSRFTYPQTLRNQKIAVRYHHGSHYATLQALEGFLKRDEIKAVHLSHTDGYEAVRRGEIAAVTLVEPWITVAEKEGFQRIVETHYTGSEIANPNVDPETWAAVNRAIRKAVRLINADKRKYLHYLIERLPPQYARLITPDDFFLPRLRFVDPEPYAPEEFQATYDWLVDWGLIAPNSSYEQLVDNRISSIAAER